MFYNKKTGEYPAIPKDGERFLTVNPHGTFEVRTVWPKGSHIGTFSPETALKIMGWNCITQYNAAIEGMTVTGLKRHEWGGYELTIENKRCWPRTLKQAKKAVLDGLLAKQQKGQVKYRTEQEFLKRLDNTVRL